MANIAIIGGGLAGLAAATALADHDCQVTLFEAKRRLGGRAGSYIDRASGESIDHCQHVAMGCCTNYLDFCRRTGVADLLERHTTLHFFDANGRRSDFRPSTWLPAPLHLLPPLLRLKHLTLADKCSIARAMLRLMKSSPADNSTVLNWLHAQRQSLSAIERFWQVVLVSALAESLDRASLAAARKVFLDGFLAHRDASNLLIPRVSLAELYDRVAAGLCSRGVMIRLASSVATLLGTANGVTGLRLADGSEPNFDYVVLAVPWRHVADLLPRPLLAAIDPNGHFNSIEASPISSVHLWFDQPITELPHAVFIGRLSQWIFARQTKNASREPYYQVVISASHNLANRERTAVVNEVLDDLRAVFPAAASATLRRWQLITEHEAVFSCRPGLDATRPRQQTAIPNLLLAGDWTATGWPSTMEGAVKSGYLAAEAILSKLGRPHPIVIPDLPRNWLMNRLIPSD
jgi:squalene-associated FAD-dependent desaturase